METERGSLSQWSSMMKMIEKWSLNLNQLGLKGLMMIALSREEEIITRMLNHILLVELLGMVRIMKPEGVEKMMIIIGSMSAYKG